MDDWIPTNTGNSTTGDGAFERFITAAVAAIITIMFSWRLLAEQSEGGEEEGAVGGGPRTQIEEAKVQVREELVKELTRYKQQQLKLSSSPVDKVDGSLGNTGERDGDSQGNTNKGASSDKERKIQDIPIDEYFSTEGQGLKKWPSIETNNDSGFDSNRLPLQRSLSDGEQASSAFQDFLDEEFNPFNPFDPFGNSDPFDDNAEPRVLDSDEEMYCCNMLETIMEEDSDEIPSSESDNDSLRRFNPHKHKKDGSSGESDNDSLKRFNPKKFKPEKSGSESDSDSIQPHDIEPQNGQLKRYATQKLENESLMEVVVPEQTTNILNNSVDSDEDEEYTGSSTSHVTLFTRETVSIQDSDGTLARTNTVHKIKVPFSEDLTIHQLMARAVAYPIEAPPEETNSSESDESVVTVLTRQNSSTTIDSNGSPKMIENVPNSNASSAFPVLTPGSHSDEYRSDDQSHTSQIEAGTYSSINTQPAYYNNSTCEVTSTQFVHIPPNSSWVAGRNNDSDNHSSSSERQKDSSPVNNAGDYDKAAGHVDINKDVSNLISDSTHSNKPSNHNLQPGIDKIYSSRAAEIVSQHKLKVDQALENLSGVLHNKNREGGNRGDRLTPVYRTGQTNQSKTVDKSSDKTISEKSVNNTVLRTVPSVSHDTVINQKQLKTINSETNPISTEKNICDNVTDNCDRVKYVDAQESTAVKNSPQSFTFIKNKEHFIDFKQTNFTLNRDQEDIQSVQDNLEADLKPVPVPRKRLSVDNSKAIEESDSAQEQSTPTIQISEEKSTAQKIPLKIIVPKERDFDFDTDSETHPDLTALKRQKLNVIEHNYNRQSDIEDSDEIADQSFDDDDFENLACVEEVLGKYKTGASPKLQLNIHKEEDYQEGNKDQKLETNIDDVFDEEEPELIEVFDEETGLWVVQSQDGTVHELLNDVPTDGESERAIFLKRCVRQSIDDLEPGNFLDFSRGVEESPPDGGSPARTSSPVLCLNERPKPRFQLTPSITDIEPVLQAASDKLNRRASVEDSPVLKFIDVKPKLSKDKKSTVSSKATSGETVPKRSSRQTPIRRSKSKETTFGPEPNTASKETTFGPEPDIPSNKTKIQPVPEISSNKTRNQPEPVVKPKQEPVKREFTQPNKTHQVSTVENKTENSALKSSKTKKQDRKIHFKENVKPSTLEIQEPKSYSTLERDNPFRVNTPEKNRNIEADVLVHKPQETCIDDVLPPPPKETVIDEPVVHKSTETDIDGPLERENPFIRSNGGEINNRLSNTGPKPSRYRSKETLIDDPPTLQQKDTLKEKVHNQKSNQRRIETPIDEPPRKSLETSIDDPSPIIESKPITRHRSRETLIDDISPVLQLTTKTKKETNIDGPISVESSPIVSSPTIKSPVVKLPQSPQVTAPKSISKGRETSIDDSSPQQVQRPKAKETSIDEPTYIQKGPTVKVPVSGKPATKDQKSLETSIDDPIPQQRIVQESPIEKQTAIQRGPTIKPPVSVKPVSKGSKTLESSIDEHVPQQRIVQQSPIDKTTTIQKGPTIKPPVSAKPAAKVKKSLETSIDDPIPQQRIVQESSIEKQTAIQRGPIVKPPVSAKPAAKEKKTLESSIDDPIPQQRIVQESPIDKSTSIQRGPTIKPPVGAKLATKDKKSLETSIDDPIPQQRIVQESPIDKATTIQKGPTIKPPVGVKPVTKGSKSKETSIDDPIVAVTKKVQDGPLNKGVSNGLKETSIDDIEDVKQTNAHTLETLIDGPVIQSSPTVKAPPVVKSPTVTLPPSVKASGAGYNWSNVQLPTRVETVIDDRTTVQQSPIVKPPPAETSIDDPGFRLPPKITDTSIYESIIVVKNRQSTSESPLETDIKDQSAVTKNNVKETVIDEPDVIVNNHTETNIDDVFDSVADDSVLESPRSSVTSTSYSTSVSSHEQNLSVDVGPKLKLLPNRVNGFDGPASPNSRQSDIDDHNVTNPTSTSPDITSEEEWNNSECESINDVSSQLDDSSLDSDVKRRPRSLRQIKRKIAAHRAYKNSLHSGIPLTAAQLSAHTNREDIIASRLRFLSEGNLSKSEKNDRQRQLFDDYKKHLASPIPKIGKFTPNKRYRSKSAYSSIEKINHITELYASRIDSDESFSKPYIHQLHANCILTPEGRREILDKTLSIENLNEHLRRFGSVTSLVETDLDTWETSEKSAFPETDLDLSLYLQQPSDRAVSMTDLRTERTHRKPASRRFADRHLAPKSKSLQTLETNIDDDADDVFPVTVSRTPSVHELRVTKSLQKLNVPDWYKHSNLTKSASTILRRDSTSTMSSFGYSAFSPSLMSSPSPSVVSTSSNVVIKTRITPTSSSRIFRKYTPATSAAQDSYRRSVLDSKSKSTPNVRLPSAQYREKEKPKGLMPVPILPFRQIRAMFEAKAANAKAEQRRQEDKPKSPEMSKKESVPVPTVTFSDDENGPESPTNGISVSPRPSSPQSPTEKDKTKNKSGSSSLNTSFEKRLPKPILKLTEHFTKSSKSKTAVTPPRVKSPETVLPASNIQTEATISIPESAVIKRPVIEITEPKQTAVLNKTKPQPPPKPEPKPRSVDSTTRTPESQPPPPPSHNRPLFSYGSKIDTWRRPLPATPISHYSTPRSIHEDFYLTNTTTTTTSSYSKIPNGVIYHDIVVSSSKPEQATSLEDVLKKEQATSLEDVLNCMLALDGPRKPTIKRRNTTGRDASRRSPDRKQYRRFLSDDALESRSRDICSTTWSADYYDGTDHHLHDSADDLDDVIVHCENPDCENNCLMSVAKRNYLTCHNCYTYYCSKDCRKHDWTTHKNDCYVTRVSNMCKNIIKTVNKDSHILYYVSRFARRGYLHRGRGCIVLNFENISTAQKLLQEGLRHSTISPMYMTVAEIDRVKLFGEVRGGLTELCSNYNPDNKFILYVGIGCGSQIYYDNIAPPRTNGTGIAKCAALRLSPAHSIPNLDELDDISVLVLAAPQGSDNTGNAEKRKSREMGLINIQRKLQKRGVTLRYQYPEMYYKLINFVSDSKPFSPELLFPMDSQTGQRFTCIILIESEHELVWMQDKKQEVF